MSLSGQITAKLVGETALAAMFVLGAVLLLIWAPATVPWWIQVLASILLLIPPLVFMVACALRHARGGTTDLELVDGDRSLTMTNIRPVEMAAAIRQASAWHRRLPMAMPAGTVVGNPAELRDVREDRTA